MGYEWQQKPRKHSPWAYLCQHCHLEHGEHAWNRPKNTACYICKAPRPSVPFYYHDAVHQEKADAKGKDKDRAKGKGKAGGKADGKGKDGGKGKGKAADKGKGKGAKGSKGEKGKKGRERAKSEAARTARAFDCPPRR